MFSNSLGFQSMSGATQPSTSVPLTERGERKFNNKMFENMSPAKTSLNVFS